MTIALKRTMLFVCALLVVELLAFAGVVFASQGAQITGGIPKMIPADPTYIQPVETEVAVDEPIVEVVEEPVIEEISEEIWEEETEIETPAAASDGFVDANVDGAWIAGSDFMVQGVHYDGSGYSYTYYSENVLPGGGLNIPGRHVGDEGYVMDGNGNLCLASDDLPYGTVVNVPFGTGTAVVYDCGSGYGNLDVYVSW